MQTLKDRLLDAALPNVPFDGWSPATFRAAVAATGATEAEARAACPRGAPDLAVRFHERSDEGMVRRLRDEDLAAMKIRERITAAVRARIEAIDDKEAVRKSAALFALPHMAAEGTRLIWNTADAIWKAVGDRSDDINWYTKRATLSGVYGSTVLFWLGDDSPDHENTWDFLDRRIEDVMRIEKAKSALRDSPVLSRLLAVPMEILGKVRAPARMPPVDLPGHWTPRTDPPETQGAGDDPGRGAAGSPGTETPGAAGSAASGPA